MSESPVPMIGLLHGSWGGGWVWEEVIGALAEGGTRVWAPTLSAYPDGGMHAPAAGAEIDHETHAREVLAAIAERDAHDLVLVGHSYGALVAQIVAARVPERIRALVVLDGFLARQGSSIFDLHPEVDTLLSSIVDPARPWQVPVPPSAMLGVPEGLAAQRHDRHARPLPIGTHARPVDQDLAPLARLPRHYLRCAHFPVFEATLEAARRQGWHGGEIATGHMAMLSEPLGLATRLLAIARQPGVANPSLGD